MRRHKKTQAKKPSKLSMSSVMDSSVGVSAESVPAKITNGNLAMLKQLQELEWKRDEVSELNWQRVCNYAGMVLSILFKTKADSITATTSGFMASKTIKNGLYYLKRKFFSSAAEVVSAATCASEELLAERITATQQQIARQEKIGEATEVVTSCMAMLIFFLSLYDFEVLAVFPAFLRRILSSSPLPLLASKAVAYLEVKRSQRKISEKAIACIQGPFNKIAKAINQGDWQMFVGGEK